MNVCESLSYGHVFVDAGDDTVLAFNQLRLIMVTAMRASMLGRDAWRRVNEYY